MAENKNLKGLLKAEGLMCVQIDKRLTYSWIYHNMKYIYQ